MIGLTPDADGRITDRYITPLPISTSALPAADTIAFDDDNRIQSFNGSAVTSDLDGNMTNGPLPNGTIGAYTFDGRCRLTGVAASTTYRYATDGQRVSVTSGSTTSTYVVDPNFLSRTLSRTKNNVTTYYVYGLGLLYEVSGTTTRTYHYDENGNTVALTADNGRTISDRVAYSSYGTIVGRTGGTDTPFLFNGAFGVMTDDNGLYYMRARYYNPRIMRFVNADPLGFGGGSNFYAFADGNPVSFMDPFGLCAEGSGRGMWADAALAGLDSGNRYAGAGLEVMKVWKWPQNIADTAGGNLAAAMYDTGNYFGWDNNIAYLKQQFGTAEGWGGMLTGMLVASLAPSGAQARPTGVGSIPNRFAGVRQASQYLQEMGVTRAERVRILQSFDVDAMKLGTAGQSDFGLRFFSNPNKAGGSYLFRTFPASRSSLAIKPQWSTMSGFREFQVRPGTTILEGPAAAQGPLLPGGQTQMFILDWQSNLLDP